jgi:hypothetical protein
MTTGDPWTLTCFKKRNEKLHEQHGMVHLYKFIARYVRKVHPDSTITRDLSENVGVSFIDMITPSDIAYGICLVKMVKICGIQKFN